MPAIHERVHGARAVGGKTGEAPELPGTAGDPKKEKSKPGVAISSAADGAAGSGGEVHTGQMKGQGKGKDDPWACLLSWRDAPMQHCGHDQCRLAAHTDPSYEGFCCWICRHEGEGYHGPLCQRRWFKLHPSEIAVETDPWPWSRVHGELPLHRAAEQMGLS